MTSLGTPDLWWVKSERLEHPKATIRLGGGANGSFRLPVCDLSFARGSEGADSTHDFARLRITRKVTARQFDVMAPFYEEMWLCRARKEYDDERLLRGEIPAIDRACYQDAVRLRMTPILNLISVDARLNCRLLAIELDPASGGILSIRFSSMPLRVVLVNAAPVEHIAICQALRKLLKV